jgi:hypothetical protein
MLRKLSYLAFAALLSFSPLIGSAQMQSDSTGVHRTYRTGTTKVMHHKTNRKSHRIGKRTMYHTQRKTTVKPSGTY